MQRHGKTRYEFRLRERGVREGIATTMTLNGRELMSHFDITLDPQSKKLIVGYGEIDEKAQDRLENKLALMSLTGEIVKLRVVEWMH